MNSKTAYVAGVNCRCHTQKPCSRITTSMDEWSIVPNQQDARNYAIR